MSYSEPLIRQLWVFLAFSGVGFLLGAVYLGFFFLRNLFQNGKAATVVCDLLFCLCVFTALFGAFLGYTDGVWRLPELLSGAAGFFGFQRTLGALLSPPARKAAALVSGCANAFFRFAGTRAAALQSRAARLCGRLKQAAGKRRAEKEKRRAERFAEAEKKTPKKEKKHAKALAKPKKKQYNDNCKNLDFS